VSEQPPIVPEPTNLSWESAVVIHQGRLLLREEVRTRTGTFVFFLPPEMAELMAEHLIHHARLAKQGIIVPGEMLLRPPADPKNN